MRNHTRIFATVATFTFAFAGFSRGDEPQGNAGPREPARNEGGFTRLVDRAAFVDFDDDGEVDVLVAQKQAPMIVERITDASGQPVYVARIQDPAAEARREHEQAVATRQKALDEAADALRFARIQDPAAEARRAYEEAEATRQKALGEVADALRYQFDQFQTIQDMRWEIGVLLAPVDETLRAHLKIPEGEGVVVLRVFPDSPAENDGVKANDIIVKLNDQPIHSRPELIKLTRDLKGKDLSLELIRAGKKMKIELKSKRKEKTLNSTIKFYHPQINIPGPQLGITVVDINETLREQLKLTKGEGVLVQSVVPDSAAAKAGVHKDDILLKLDDRPISGVDALPEMVKSIGEKKVKLELIHEGGQKTVDVQPEKPKTLEADSVRMRLFDNVKRVMRVPEGAGGQFPGGIPGGPPSGMQPMMGMQMMPPINLGAFTREEKRLDELSKQIQELRQSIEELKKIVKEERSK